ncbi:ArsR family transcriptional regulator [Thermotomaculum hydrothermale]|uniref:ArsR family transcriptional regulator n=1 Tax=Thermotomaculum hydrothermale TaxID=981385 RepID=A0A7R6PF68_9BACT|nr:metalloregulator ArsR/SmtB family transcription factor [Thermotomaculum hydrothermale]BBB32613.1 ArsR family transcriptional regulator [Thermotomaculum hydrothermale]
MKEKEKFKSELLANIMKALAHPTRAFIVLELERKELCVCDLTEKIDADVSTVSKHLSVLKKAGIVKSEKRGLQFFYSLVTPCVLNFFLCVEEKLKRDLKRKSDFLEE